MLSSLALVLWEVIPDGQLDISVIGLQRKEENKVQKTLSRRKLENQQSYIIGCILEVQIYECRQQHII